MKTIRFPDGQPALEIQTFHEVARALTSSVDLSGILHAIMQQMTQLLQPSSLVVAGSGRAQASTLLWRYFRWTNGKIAPQAHPSRPGHSRLGCAPRRADDFDQRS